MKAVYLAIAGIVVCLFGCAGLGLVAPADFLLNLVFGWGVYLWRVVPEVSINWAGVLTAVVCLVLLAIGLQRFLRWFHAQSVLPVATLRVRRWPFRWTLAVVAVFVLMFVSGIAAVGFTHQTAWLVTSPEPLMQGGGEPIWRIQSANNLKQMALGMLNYADADEHKRLPPAAIFGKNGEPLLSWRVLLLPYFEEELLFQKFKLDEPWDSPHNLQLLPRMPRIYAPPHSWRPTKPNCTFYQVFVGKGAAFEGKEGLRYPQDFPDGISDTILIVEAGESVPWTKPEDLNYDPLEPLPELGGIIRDGSNVARADGSVKFVNRDIGERTLRALITRNGADIVGNDW